MPRIQVEQDSFDWHDLRSKKLGASDVSAIMGTSPYMSPYELWLLKTGRRPPIKTTPAMQYGKDMEPILRQKYLEQTDEPFLPAVYQHDNFDFLMASLDGINFHEDKILEIKACNKDVFSQAQDGKVADHYYPQLQLQLSCVPSAKEVHFFCYHKEQTITVIVQRDEEFIKEMLHLCSEFWDHVQNDVPPPSRESDCLLIEDDPEFEEAVTQWRTYKSQLERFKQLESEAKKKLIDLTDDGNIEAYGVEIKKRYSNRIDYKKACDDANLDTKSYQKTTVSWFIKELNRE